MKVKKSFFFNGKHIYMSSWLVDTGYAADGVLSFGGPDTTPEYVMRRLEHLLTQLENKIKDTNIKKAYYSMKKNTTWTPENVQGLIDYLKQILVL